MIDIVVILFIALFTWRGYRRGFAATLVSSIATILSFVFSIFLTKPIAIAIASSPLGDLFRKLAENIVLENFTGITTPEYSHAIAVESITMLFSAVLSFVLISVVIRILAGFLASALKIITKLPVIKQANAVFGLVIGLLTSILICYVAFGLVQALGLVGISNGGVISMIEQSRLGEMFCNNNLITNTLLQMLR